jgi:hypothetical protein
MDAAAAFQQFQEISSDTSSHGVPLLVQLVAAPSSSRYEPAPEATARVSGMGGGYTPGGPISVQGGGLAPSRERRQ